MKSLTNILRRSQLTPRERVTALVHNNVQKEKTGKSIFSDAEIQSIAKLWIPRSNEEVRQFNNYISLMNLESIMEIEIQRYYTESDNALLRVHRIIDAMRTYTSLEEFIERDPAKEYISEADALNFILENSYLEYEHLVHMMTFYNLDPDIQDDLKILDPYIANDPKYIQQEVILYELLHRNGSFDETVKKKLVDSLWDTMYSEKLRKQRGGSDTAGILVHNSFASIPVNQMLYVCAEYLSFPIDYDNEQYIEILLQDLQYYADKKQSTLELVIKPLLSQWIHDGLFISQHIALYLSNTKETWSGVTHEKHSKLFSLWYHELQKSKQYLDNLIDTQDLECIRYQDGISVVTGKSLYTSKHTIEFVNNFKEQIRYLIPIVNLFLFIKTYSYPLKRYATMKAFIELAQEFSQIFDIDLSQKYVEYSDEFKMQLIAVNMNILMVLEKFNEFLHSADSYNYCISTDIQAFTFDLDQEYEVEEMIMKYREEIEKNK